MFLFNSAFHDAHTKFFKYFVDGAQPASKFLGQILVLHPRILIDAEQNFASMDSIARFKAVPRDEWDLNVNHLRPLAVKDNKDDNFNLTLVWKSKGNNLPELYKLASRYVTTNIDCYDVERSFYSYNEILDENQDLVQRRKKKSYKQLVISLLQTCNLRQSLGWFMD